MLTDAEIASMQETAESALPDTGVILRLTRTSDGGGGGTSVYSAVGTVDCRLAPMAPQEYPEQVRGDRIDAERRFTITFPADTEIRTADRVTVAGGTFTVSAVAERGEWDLDRRIEARRES